MALDFVCDTTVLDTEEVILAGGCFWGVDFLLGQLPGVIKTEVGYSGGHVIEPTYSQVCAGDTGHYEVVRVLFDRDKTRSEEILKHFFEIHDPTHPNGQGPDLGHQYQSAVFVYDEKQELITQNLIKKLVDKGFNVQTKILPVQIFWRAEDYHQHYYKKNNQKPYCHYPKPRF